MTRAELEKLIAARGDPVCYFCPEDHPHETMDEAVECLIVSAAAQGIIIDIEIDEEPS